MNMSMSMYVYVSFSSLSPFHIPFKVIFIYSVCLFSTCNLCNAKKCYI